MDHKQKAALAVAVAASLGGVGVVDAAVINVALKSVLSYSPNGTSAANLSLNTASWIYDDVAMKLTQSGGIYQPFFTTAPFTTIFRHTITGLSIGGPVSASTFSCVEGGFGATVGASICGNYNFGANKANQSTTTWGPGIAAARTIGGDDMALAPQQSIADYNYFAQVSFVGTTLVLSNGFCFSSCTSLTDGFNAGYKWTLNTVPVPAAVWLFGSALGLLGAARRRVTA